MCVFSVTGTCVRVLPFKTPKDQFLLPQVRWSQLTHNAHLGRTMGCVLAQLSPHISGENTVDTKLSWGRAEFGGEMQLCNSSAPLVPPNYYCEWSSVFFMVGVFTVPRAVTLGLWNTAAARDRLWMHMRLFGWLGRAWLLGVLIPSLSRYSFIFMRFD